MCKQKVGELWSEEGGDVVGELIESVDGARAPPLSGVSHVIIKLGRGRGIASQLSHICMRLVDIIFR